MQLRTEIEITPSAVKIGYDSKILMMGSCFAENIGNWLEQNYFDALVNPFGILYNPLSIARALEILMDEKQYTTKDIFLANGVYNSFEHHSRFSDKDPQQMLDRINQERVRATGHLLESDILIITLGTAWVYSLAETGVCVANCHKLPEKRFLRRRLGINEILCVWQKTMQRLHSLNPGLKIIFTLSPIRHIKDTLQGNQVSKSTLRVAIEEMCSAPANEYFPSYEILIDDLRDYRFYASDMLHPSDVAVEYIRQKFAEAYFTRPTKEMLIKAEKINRALQHRPSDEQSPRYKEFLMQNISNLEHLIEKSPYFTLFKPLNEFKARLNNITD